MYRKLWVISIILLWPSCSFGQFKEFVTSYFEDLEKVNASTFFSRCGSRKDKEYLATIIIEAGSKKGLLIEERGKVIINLASLVISESGIHIEETHGGIYTRERVTKLVDEIAGKNFQLIVPFARIKLQKVGLVGQCLNTL